MSSWAIVKRAWAGTLVGLGISNFSPFRMLLWLAVSAVFVTFIWIWRGESAAMTEASDIVLYTLAFAGVAFLPIFLWHLWLAPHKILNERLDKVSDAQTPPKAGDEEAARRSHNVVKAESARREMESLRYCLDEREDSRSGHSYLPMGSREFDYDFEALKEKYGSWFPPDFEEQSMKDWAGHIIATLKTNEYDSSVRRIERAVAAKSWVEGAPNDG